jgi:hypothetical protein
LRIRHWSSLVIEIVYVVVNNHDEFNIYSWERASWYSQHCVASSVSYSKPAIQSFILDLIMHVQLLSILFFSSQGLASPLALPQGTGSGADSCPAKPLEPQTWTDLKIDDFLTSAAKNYIRTLTNNIQSLAASFGAPNFFCGLDKFCNAGQPCLPIQLLAWYVTSLRTLVARWNSNQFP